VWQAQMSGALSAIDKHLSDNLSMIPDGKGSLTLVALINLKFKGF